MNIDRLRSSTLRFIENHRLPGGTIGQYRYSLTTTMPTLYSSAYAAMTRSLYRDLDDLDQAQKQEWIDYLNHYQDDDGLYCDPVIFDQGWYEDDPLWCGRSHLTCHVLGALTCLGGVSKKRIRWISSFDNLEHWLEERNWGEQIDFTGNEIMNVGTILQYARDFHHDDRAGRAVELLLHWLDHHHLNADTGVWGSMGTATPYNRSRSVQAAYHWWALYFYDRHSVPHVERAIDTVLATQNTNGGFGCGVHNPDDPLKSSACEDIDSIDPLARMMMQTRYRHDDVRCALERAMDWVLTNQMPDGGFVFIRDRSFEYGHPELSSGTNVGAMFPTWFRTLSLAILGKAFPHTWLGQYPWNFVRCPGYQFWSES